MKNALIEFFSKFVKTVETPKYYGPFHLPFVLIGIPLMVLLAWLLRKSSEKRTRIVLLISGGILLLLELFKQGYCTYTGSNAGVYKWWYVPFHICSVPMYLCIIAPLLKKSAVRDALYGFCAAFSLLGGLATLLVTNPTLGGSLAINIHSMLWHVVLVFIGFFLCFNFLPTQKLKSYWLVAVVFDVLALIALLINILVKKYAGATINMFFIGPAKSTIPIIGDLVMKIGAVPYAIIYLMVMPLAGLLVYLIFCRRTKRAKQEEPTNP